MSESNDSLRQVKLIDAFADEFQQAWKSSDRPRIEDYLARAPHSARANLLSELVGLEIELRRIAGETPTREEYAGRFNDERSVVASVFDADGSSFAPYATQTFSSGAHTPTEAMNDRQIAAAASAAEAPPDLPAIDAFDIQRRLGKGAFGEVYLARDTRIDRDVAIKVLVSAEESSVTSLLNEARHKERWIIRALSPSIRWASWRPVSITSSASFCRAAAWPICSPRAGDSPWLKSSG